MFFYKLPCTQLGPQYSSTFNIMICLFPCITLFRGKLNPEFETRVSRGIIHTCIVVVPDRLNPTRQMPSSLTMTTTSFVIEIQWIIPMRIVGFICKSIIFNNIFYYTVEGVYVTDNVSKNYFTKLYMLEFNHY